jgi:hypothetical protein
LFSKVYADLLDDVRILVFKDVTCATEYLLLLLSKLLSGTVGDVIVLIPYLGILSLETFKALLK